MSPLSAKNGALKLGGRIIITMSADENSLFHSCSWFEADLMRAGSRFPCLVFMCAYVFEDVWDDCGGRGWRAIEQSCLICAWGEKYPRVQCVMESRQYEGNL